jgi:hypothetical protein
MSSITVAHPVTGVEASIRICGHVFVDGKPHMVRVDEFPVYLSRSHGGGRFPARLDTATRIARLMVGDYDCGECGGRIHWLAEPRQVYVHNDSGQAGCAGGAGVARPVI